MEGLIHLYCGEGKGKTTAALGLALRAAGAGIKVAVLQFMKGSDTSELRSLALLENITVLRNKEDCGFYGSMTEGQKEKVRAMHDENLAAALTLVREGRCGLLILDEVTYAYAWDLVCRERLEGLLTDKPEGLEIVMTGRNPDAFLTEKADYITEMKCIRHPYMRNVPARRGIEF